MNDRILLELAAKAAGIKIDKSEFNGGGRSTVVGEDTPDLTCSVTQCLIGTMGRYGIH